MVAEFMPRLKNLPIRARETLATRIKGRVIPQEAMSFIGREKRTSFLRRWWTMPCIMGKLAFPSCLSF